MARIFPLIALLSLTPMVWAQGWPQWAGGPGHESSTVVAARNIDRIEQQIVLDPFAGAMKVFSGGDLLAHYPVPLADGEDLVVVRKSGTFTTPAERNTQVWNVVNFRRTDGRWQERWSYASDWKPVPFGSPNWEPVHHPALGSDSVWIPAAGGTVDRVDRRTGLRMARLNPFGPSLNPNIFVTGPLTPDAAGNLYYNALELVPSAPWTADPPNAWLVRLGSDGTMQTAAFASLVTGAPLPDARCTGQFDLNQLPWPPSQNAVAPTVRCGPQRPGINVAPAIGSDGSVYTVSRAHLNSRYGYLVAANPDLTPKWSASMRNRFQDGCDVLLPPGGTPGGCRAGSIKGVDPSDNQPGSGAVNDNSTASPVVAPDGTILYGAFSRYNYAQGHLMKFSPGGLFLGAYGWGWDLTPAIYRHHGTYSILLKENHYSVGSYCSDDRACPGDRSSATPADPEAYFITRLNPSLQPEWQFRNTNPESCERQSDGTVRCSSDHPAGFEWCVNALAVDGRGVVYATSEDGHLYAIGPDGQLRQRLFLRLALGAAYTASSIGPDGRVYAQNDGSLFVIDQGPKRRAVRSR